MENSPFEQHIQIGSFSARAFFESRADAVVLNEMFRDTVCEPSDADTAADAELYWFHSPSRETPISVPTDGLNVTRSDDRTWHVESELLTARLELAPRAKIRLCSYPHTLPPLAWRVHVSTVFHKLLMLMGRIYLHAGGVQTGAGASAFVGNKGSGKSTICVWLGRAGATILSDDHISICRINGAFHASGCENVARVTSETEAAVLPEILTMQAREYAGTLKKEFPVGDLFHAMTWRDVPLQRIFFPHVGARWQIEELSPRNLMTRLLETTHSSHRFANKDDYVRHLDYFSALARAVRGFDLELTPNLTELDRLVTFLRA